VDGLQEALAASNTAKPTQAEVRQEKKEMLGALVSLLGEQHKKSLGRLPLETLTALCKKIKMSAGGDRH
jgi:hypothetical protein